MTHYTLHITLPSKPKFANQSWVESAHTAINVHLQHASHALAISVEKVWERLVAGETVIAAGVTLVAINQGYTTIAYDGFTSIKETFDTLVEAKANAREELKWENTKWVQISHKGETLSTEHATN